MLKKSITYTDYNGIERTEDFYFNLTEAELTEMEMSTTGGLGNMMQKLVASKDMAGVMHVFKEILMKAYGEKSADGRRFVKSSDISEAFTQTEAYSMLFMELVSDEAKMAAFINGILPADVVKRAQANGMPKLNA